MSVSLSLVAGAGAQFFDDNGEPLSGGLLYTYLAGTTTPAATFTDSTGGTYQANPIVMDAAGRLPYELWLTDGVSYKFILRTSTNVQIWSHDNISGANGSLNNTTTFPPGAAQIGFRQGTASGYYPNTLSSTVYTKLRDLIMISDFSNTSSYQTASSAFSTGGFYIDRTPTPRFWRLADRVFADKAVQFSGSYYGTDNAYYPVPRWVSRDSSLVVWSGSGRQAICGASRSSSVVGQPNEGSIFNAAIGVIGISVNDYINSLPSYHNAWGGYFESFREAGVTSACFGVEIDIGNASSNTNPQNFPALPYGGGLFGLCVASGGSRLGATGSGGGYTGPASCAILITNNQQTFNKGIVFENRSITGVTGDGTSTGVAIAMSAGHIISWYNNTNSAIANIYSTVTSLNDRIQLGFTPNIVRFTAAAASAFEIVYTNTTVNFIRATAAPTGVQPHLSAQGADTNIDLALYPKGTGKLIYGNFTASADAPVIGYIEIKDNGGTVRKIPVIA